MLGMVGCDTTTSWTQVKDNEALIIFYGSEYRSYFGDSCEYLAYQHNKNYTTIKVKYQIKEQSQSVDTYMGNNLNIMVWGK